MVSDVIDSDEILQLQRLKETLIVSAVFANSIRMFQNEVAMELDLLRSKDISQSSKTEEPKKCAEMEAEIQRIKQTIEDEYRPLMNSLKEEMENRRNYLDENR